MTDLNNILESEEYRARCKVLSKRNFAEKRILALLLLDPFPLNLNEPITKTYFTQPGEPAYNSEPDPKAWLYFNLEKITDAPVFLPEQLYLVDKVLYSCWKITHPLTGKRSSSMGKPYMQNVHGYIHNALNELGLTVNHIDSLCIPETKTVLHYLRFGISDTEKNLWLPPVC